MPDFSFRQVFASFEPARISEVEEDLQTRGIDFEEREDVQLPIMPPLSGPPLGGSSANQSLLYKLIDESDTVDPPRRLHRVMIHRRDMHRAKSSFNDKCA